MKHSQRRTQNYFVACMQPHFRLPSADVCVYLKWTQSGRLLDTLPKVERLDRIRLFG